jgi:tetratricopeptide (TPR) repeat protein
MGVCRLGFSMKKALALIICSLFCICSTRQLCAQQTNAVPEQFIYTFEYAKAKAETGDAKAQTYLGFCYENGLEVKKDYAEALKWFHKAVDQNYAEAQRNLGWCYYRGHGVQRDYVEAVKWFQKAADQNNLQAQCQLGDCYGDGNGVPKDPVEAIKWYEKAADQNYVPAQFYLSYCYNKDHLVKKNIVEYYKWESLTLSHVKDSDVPIVLDEIAKRMTPDQLAQAQKEIGEFQVSHPNQPANQ